MSTGVSQDMSLLEGVETEVSKHRAKCGSVNTTSSSSDYKCGDDGSRNMLDNNLGKDVGKCKYSFPWKTVVAQGSTHADACASVSRFDNQ